MVAVLLISAWLSVANATSAPLTVHFHERPPYYRSITGSPPTGLVADPVVKSFSRLPLAVRYQQTPAKRQLQILRDNQSRDCAIGWFKNAERETWLQYSDPIYQDQPLVVVARRDDQRLAAPLTLKQLFSQPLVWLKKSGYSYGAAIDQESRRSTISVDERSIDSLSSLHLLIRGRADFVLMAPEEFSQLSAQHSLLREPLQSRTLAESLPGEQRYLICSRQVEPELLQQFNAELKTLASHPPQVESTTAP